MHIILSEILTTEYVISTPFNALLGRVPVVVYAVLDNTVVLQIIGEDLRKVVRHDLINVDPDKLRARPSPILDALHKSREKGRLNSRKTHDKGIETEEDTSSDYFTESIAISENKNGWAKYDPVEVLAKNAKSDSSQEG